MTTNDQATLNYLKQTLVELNPSKLILFGSRARGDASERSDFDIAVVGSHITHAKWAQTVVTIKENIPTLCGIDLILMNDTTPHDLAKRIEREGKIIYEK